MSRFFLNGIPPPRKYAIFYCFFLIVRFIFNGRAK